MSELELSIYGGSMNRGSMPLLSSRAYLSDLYVRALSSVYHGYRIWEPSYADSREPDLFEKVRRDPIIAQALEQRLHSVACRRWNIVPASDSEEDRAAAQVVEGLLKKVHRFSESRYELAQAVVTSRSYSYIEGQRRRMSFNGTVANWWVPSRLRDVDRRRMRLVPVWETKDGKNQMVRTELQMYSVTRMDWLTLQTPGRFVKHTYNDEEARLGYGRGLLEAIYFYHFAKGVVLREGLQGLERWAQGFVTASIEGLREASTGKTNDDLRKAWLDALEKSRSRHVIAHDSRDQIQVHTGGQEGNSMALGFLEYLDSAMTRLITGALLPSGGGETGGSYARAEEEGDQSESLVQYDRTMLDETLTVDLIAFLWRANRIPIRQIGLGDAAMPLFSSIQERKEDPEQATSTIVQLLGAGVPLLKEEVYGRAGYTVPMEGDDVIGGEGFNQPKPGEGPPGGEEGAGGGGDGEMPPLPFRLTEDGDSVVFLADDGSPIAVFDKRERCPDGTFQPESGDCSGHGSAVAKTGAEKVASGAGGFTIDRKLKNTPKHGFVFSPFPEKSKTIDMPKGREALRAALDDYLSETAEFMAEDPRRMFGGWVDSDGKLWLDVVLVENDEAKALKRCKEANQIAMWALHKGQEVDCGGTGESGAKSGGGEGAQARAQEGPVRLRSEGSGPGRDGGRDHGARGADGGGRRRRGEVGSSFDDRKRCPDGTFMPEDGDCTGHEEAPEETKATRPKGPGPQKVSKMVELRAPSEMVEKVKSLGRSVKKDLKATGVEASYSKRGDTHSWKFEITSESSVDARSVAESLKTRLADWTETDAEIEKVQTSANERMVSIALSTRGEPTATNWDLPYEEMAKNGYAGRPPPGATDVKFLGYGGKWAAEWTSMGTRQRAYKTEFLQGNQDKKWARNEKVIKPHIEKFRKGLTKMLKDEEKVGTVEHEAAIILGLMDHTSMRTGGAKVGASNLETRHVKIEGPRKAVLSYIGKDSITQRRVVTDPTLVNLLRRYSETPETVGKKKLLFRPAANAAASKLMKRFFPGDPGVVPYDLRRNRGTTHAEEQFEKLTPSRWPTDPKKKKARALRVIAEVFESSAVLLGHKSRDKETGAWKVQKGGTTAKAKYTDPRVIEAWIEKNGLRELLTKKPSKAKKKSKPKRKRVQ